MANLKIGDILDNIKQVSMSPSSMDILREFERVIDENGLYAFHNWKTLSMALRGGQISDFPLINKSFNLSYSGNDL